MKDPFPFEPSPWMSSIFRKAAQPLADYFGLKTIPLHVHEILFAFLLYHLTNVYFSPILSRWLFPRTYPHIDRRTKINWDVHVVSMLQSCLICALALYVHFYDEERKNMNWQGRVWGYTGACGLVQAMAAGYFLWDIWVSTVNVKIFGLGLWAHAISALLVFCLGFRPFVNFYGPTFILYELSSPFLNIHWFCDKLSLTGSNLQLYNGILLITTFFFCRLCWGTYQSYRVFSDVWWHAMDLTLQESLKASAQALGDAGGDEPVSEIMRFAGERTVPMWLAISYLGANITLNALNFFWFSKMIETIRKRFEPPFGTKKPEPKKRARRTSIGEKILVEGVDVDTDEDPESFKEQRLLNGERDEITISRGVDAENRTSVEVEKKEVRHRSTRRRG